MKKKNIKLVLVDAFMESAVRLMMLLALVFVVFNMTRPFLLLLLWAGVLSVVLMPLGCLLCRIFRVNWAVAVWSIIITVAVVLVGLMVVLSGTIFNGALKAIEYFSLEDISALSVTPVFLAEIPYLGPHFDGLLQNAVNDFSGVLVLVFPYVQVAIKWFAGLVGGFVESVAITVIAVFLSGFFMQFSVPLVSLLNATARRALNDENNEWVTLSALTIRSVLTGVIGIALLQSIWIGSVFFVYDFTAPLLLSFLVFIACIAQFPATLLMFPLVVYMYLSLDVVPATGFMVWVMSGALLDNVLKPLCLGRGLSTPMPVILLGALVFKYGKKSIPASE
ncbi:AI-2E family transporter [Vibrio sp. PNB22_3_1]